ncbi:MAG: LysR family transcriptional regulator [Nannocystaceae bacterium]|nr:LysR family transcriptional regulator [Nannocystaceae bacterium]
MDTLQTMKIFVRVAQRSGFAAAARDLRMSAAAVTKHVAALEARIGARLFDRTTRSVSLTEAGRVYLERCMECLQAFEDADASVSELSNAPSGRLRVTAPIDLQRHVARILGRFLDAHPRVTAELQLSNRPVDLVHEGIDVALRIAPSLEGQFIARPLATTHVVVLASPLYLAKHGRPRKPQDLPAHRAILFSEPRPRADWVFERDGKQTRVELTATMLTNGGDALRSALVEGLGIGCCPSFVLDGELESGTLEQLVPEWTIVPPLRLFAIYPHRRFLPPKVRAFVDALRDAFGDGTHDPWSPRSSARPRARRGTAAVGRAG